MAALEGSVEVSGRVAGDVVVLGGDARLASRGADRRRRLRAGRRRPRRPRGARRRGGWSPIRRPPRPWLTLIEGPSLGLGFASPLVLGTKLALLAAWAALLLLLFAASGRQLLETADERPPRALPQLLRGPDGGARPGADRPLLQRLHRRAGGGAAAGAGGPPRAAPEALGDGGGLLRPGRLAGPPRLPPPRCGRSTPRPSGCWSWASSSSSPGWASGPGRPPP